MPTIDPTTDQMGKGADVAQGFRHPTFAPAMMDERHERLLPLLRQAAKEAELRAARFRQQGNAACAEIYEDLATMRFHFLRCLER
jgi:hypothetical protein